MGRRILSETARIPRLRPDSSADAYLRDSPHSPKVTSQNPILYRRCENAFTGVCVNARRFRSSHGRPLDNYRLMRRGVTELSVGGVSACNLPLWARVAFRPDNIARY